METIRNITIAISIVACIYHLGLRYGIGPMKWKDWQKAHKRMVQRQKRYARSKRSPNCPKRISFAEAAAKKYIDYIDVVGSHENKCLFLYLKLVRDRSTEAELFRILTGKKKYILGKLLRKHAPVS